MTTKPPLVVWVRMRRTLSTGERYMDKWGSVFCHGAVITTRCNRSNCVCTFSQHVEDKKWCRISFTDRLYNGSFLVIDLSLRSKWMVSILSKLDCFNFSFFNKIPSLRFDIVLEHNVVMDWETSWTSWTERLRLRSLFQTDCAPAPNVMVN